jgi:hypothetical protein
VDRFVGGRGGVSQVYLDCLCGFFEHDECVLVLVCWHDGFRMLLVASPPAAAKLQTAMPTTTAWYSSKLQFLVPPPKPTISSATRRLCRAVRCRGAALSLSNCLRGRYHKR